MIKPLTLDDNSRYTLDSNKELDIDKNIERVKITSSGENIVINDLNIDWVYVPFYHYYSSYYSQIINEIKKDSLLCFFIDDKGLKKDIFIKAIKIKDNYNKIRKKLNNIFERNGGSNENSLILYSGTEQKTKMQFKHNCENCICNYIYCCEVNPMFSHAGCMYFGDYNAKKNYIYDKKFFEKYLNKCGVILLPHHGSLESFDDNLLFNNYKYAVSCHGKNDKYGHPSAQVCEKLYLNNKTIISVTEDSSSKAYFTVYDFI